MNKSILILALFVLSCGIDSSVKKPDTLIAETKMEDILLDLTMLKAIKSPKDNTQGKAFFTDDFILRKYEIDSLVFAQNQMYYAQNPKILARIYRRIEERLSLLSDSLDLALDQETKSSLKSRE
ncbi:MAG: DUF4296 domain-containing protein [Flavobacteriaceae bacterium]